MKNKMKLEKAVKILVIIGIIIGTTIGAEDKVFAENTSNNVTTNSSTNSQTSNTSTTEKNQTTSNTETANKVETQKEKSSNANLKNLGIKPHDFSGFKSGKTSYDVNVPEDTESVEVYAVVQDSSAKVSGTGKKELKIGENTVEVVVTAEDGTTKTYTINITRKEQEDEENTENVQERYSGDGLASIEIENLELSPKFDTNVYEYTVKYIGEKETLEIDTKATDPYYTVEVIGNEGLKEGENIITILVSDPDDNNVATYQIIVNKSLVDEEALAREQEEEARKKQQLIIGGILALIILIVIIVLIIRHKRNKTLEEEYSVPFSGLNDEDLPKVLRNTEEDNDEDNDTEEDINENGEELTKEKAREEFLNSYNTENLDEEIEEEKPRRKKSKGKRFK